MNNYNQSSINRSSRPPLLCSGVWTRVSVILDYYSHLYLLCTIELHICMHALLCNFVVHPSSRVGGVYFPILSTLGLFMWTVLSNDSSWLIFMSPNDSMYINSEQRLLYFVCFASFLYSCLPLKDEYATGSCFSLVWCLKWGAELNPSLKSQAPWAL